MPKKLIVPSSSWFIWIPIALVIKLLVCLLLYYNLELRQPYMLHGDGHMYLEAAENILNYKTYGIYKDELIGIKPYTGRMPGYELILVMLRLILSIKETLIAVVFIQILFSALSIYLLALTVKNIFQSEFLFLIVFLVYSINTYITIFDLSILTESFAISSFITGLYFVTKTTANKKDLLIAGIFLMWSVFLRQYIFPLILLLALFIIINQTFVNRKKLKAAFSFSLVFIAPFILFDSVWIIRNYRLTDKFIPLVNDLHAGYAYPDYFKSLMSLVQTWGGDIVHWNPKAEITIFKKDESIKSLQGKYNTISDLPNYIYTSSYNQDSLRRFKTHYKLLESGKLSVKKTQYYEQKIVESANNYRQSFIKEKPILYYLYSPIRLLPKFIFHSGTYNLSNKEFAKQNIFQKSFKLFYTALYWIILLGGGAGIFLVFKQKVTPPIILLIICSVYTLILCPLILRRIEYRYFVLSYPFFTIFFAYTLKESLLKLWQLLKSCNGAKV